MRPGRRITAKPLWEPRDLWLGLFWKKPEPGTVVLFLCVVPCLPVRITLSRGSTPERIEEPS